ncbi:MAG TPA: histidine kinase, partial [Terriglobia bacterium]|nr:histidine kinase [Terriglobia bacterium]
MLATAAINIAQKRRSVTPDDGCAWIETPSGVSARSLEPDGPADRAGIIPGDVLRAITANGLRHEIRAARDVARVLYETGVWSQATYSLERDGRLIETAVIIAQPTQRALRQGQYLEIIGLLYLSIGVFVLIRRSQAPHAFHFYLVCLTSFVVYSFDYTGTLDTFDWTVFWLDRIAGSLLPPLFLHFYLEFPRPEQSTTERRTAMALLYAPGAALLVAWIAFVYGLLNFIPARMESRDLLDNLGLFHFGAYFVMSAAALAWTFWQVRAPEQRQQLKWIMAGTAAALPYFLLQVFGRLGLARETLSEVAILPLALIPVSFGYAILRHRLMDVGIIFKRGVTYTLATASVIGL